MRRIVLIALLGGLLSWWLAPALADPLRGPIQVMRPDGTIFRIGSPPVERWWRDYHEARCVSCKGPHRAALLLHRVETALGTRSGAGPRYLILVESLRLGWTRAWWFYPSTDRTSAYVVHHGGVGAGDAPLRWDVWIPATPGMEAIILERTDAPSSLRSDASAPSDPGASLTATLLSWALVLAVFLGGAWAFHRFARRRPRPGTGRPD